MMRRKSGDRMEATDWSEKLADEVDPPEPGVERGQVVIGSLSDRHDPVSREGAISK